MEKGYIVSNPDFGVKNLYVSDVEMAHEAGEFADDFYPGLGYRVGGFETAEEAHEYALSKGWLCLR